MDGTRSGRRVGAVLLLCLTFLAAGCAGFSGSGAVDTPTASETRSPVPEDTETATTETPTRTNSATPTPTPTTPAVDPANPFGERTLTVRLGETPAERDVRPEVEQALAYWEGNSTEHAGYPVNFTLGEGPADARIEISFADAPIPCGYAVDERSIGCAPLNERTAPSVSEIVVAANQTDDYTVEILVHELGHVLGLDHDDEPNRYMQATHPHGLARETVRVYLGGPDDDVAGGWSEVDAALEYFEDHPALADDERPNFEFVQTVEQADFVVTFGGDCGFETGGSCSGDPPYEGQQRIVLDDLDTSVVQWHVAFLLAPSYLEDEEIPDALTSDTTRGERIRWDG